MLEKIKKILDPKIEAELHEKQKHIEDLESYISANESTENEAIMLKVLTSKNTLKRLAKELPALEERDREVTEIANSLSRAADGLKREKVVLLELEAMKNKLMPIIDTLAHCENSKVQECFNVVQYGPYGSRYTANSGGTGGVKNKILDEFMENITRETEKLKRDISQYENFLKEYPKIKKLLKV